jgi:uncharacterized membrane protein
MITFLSRAGFVAVLFLALVGIASSVNRFVGTVQFLVDPATLATRDVPPELRDFDARYFASPYATLVHVTVGFLFMVLGPLQFVGAIRNRWLRFHRWCGWVFLTASLVGVVSAVVFLPVLPVFGSFSTKVGVVVAATFFTVALVQGYRAIRRRDIATHREWMIRLFAIGLGISTFRVLLPLLMLPPLNASFPEAWDTVVWLGFVINAAVAEVWINLTRRPAVKRHVPASRAAIAIRVAEAAPVVRSAD